MQPTTNAMSVAMGMPQPRCEGVPSAQGEEDRRRHQHAADGGDDGQRGAPGITQLAQHQLPLHLEPHHEEEERHQAVVDPVVQGVAHAQRADVEADVGLPEVEVGRGERRVGEDQRDDSAREEDAARRRLDVHEALEGLDQPIDGLLGQP